MTKRGKIVFLNGTRVEFGYSLATTGPDGVCSGSLFGDIASMDPGLLMERMKLVCEDGLTINLLITHETSRGAVFVGTIAQNGHAVADPMPMSPIVVAHAFLEGK